MHRTLALAVTFVLNAGSIAHAQYAAWDPPSPNGFVEPPRSGGEVELGFWTSSRNDTFVDTGISNVNGVLRAAVVIDQLIELGVVAGWGWGRFDVDTFFGRLTYEAATAADPLLYAGAVIRDDKWR